MQGACFLVCSGGLIAGVFRFHHRLGLGFSCEKVLLEPAGDSALSLGNTILDCLVELVNSSVKLLASILPVLFERLLGLDSLGSQLGFVLLALCLC